MQPTFTKIKESSLKALQGRWPEAMLVSVSFLAVCLLNTVAQGLLMQMFKVNAVWSPFSPTTLPKISVIASVGITVFSSLFTVFISTPFFFGVLRWFWLITSGKEAPLGEIFCYFSTPKLFGKSVRLSLALFFKIVLAAVLCLLPYILWSVAFSPELYDRFQLSMPIWMSGLFPVAEFLKLLGLLAFAVISVRFLLFYVPLFTEPGLNVRATFKFATGLIHGKLFRLIGFLLSFFGWFLLSLFVLPLLFTLPFFLSSLCIYGQEELRDSVATQKI